MPNGGGSDRSLKKDVHEINAALRHIMALRPVTWRWRLGKKADQLEYGFIAQEVEKILPELVSLSSWEDGTKRKFLSTKEMIPQLVAAIQEQQKQIDELQKKVAKKQN
jgi:hypothetical protein